MTTRSNIRTFNLLIIFISVLILSGCQTTTEANKQERAAVNPALAHFSVVPFRMFTYVPVVVVKYIDGKNVRAAHFWEETFTETDLSPGTHSIEMGFFKLNLLGGETHSITNQIVKFDAKAGHRYQARVYLTTKGGDDRWDAEIVDMDTGEKFVHQ